MLSYSLSLTRSPLSQINKLIKNTLSTVAAPRRFYKNVNIVKANNERYEIILDEKKLKTPNGNIFYVNNEILAQMIANEWNMQKEKIAINQMHLTTLTNTVLDNPNKFDCESASERLTSFIESDTLCFRTPEPEELLNYQIEQWDSIVQWFADQLRCNIPVTQNMSLPAIEEESKNHIIKHFKSFNLWSLIGLLYMSENLKSIILSVALVNRKISVTDAINLSRIEENFQANRWGKVEFHHTLEDYNIQSRVAAALLFTLLNCEKNSLSQNK